MKFCHFLESTAKGLPERYDDLFQFYKGMKKALKRLPRASQQQEPHGMDNHFMAAEATMVNDFVAEIGRLNARRTVEQADAAATLARLRYAVKHPHEDLDERRQVYQDLVNFHGETLLLLHWSILGYTAVVKLLKKHQKRTGMLVQAPHLRPLLSSEAWCTDNMTLLIQEAVQLINEMEVELYASSGSNPSNGSQCGHSPTSRLDNEMLRSALAELARAESCNDSVDDSVIGSPMAADGGWAMHALHPAPSDGAASAVQGASGVSTRSDLHAEITSAPAVHASGANAGVVGSAGDAGGTAAASAERSTTATEPGSRDDFAARPNQSLLQRMQAALDMWEYLQRSASTPSTVLGGHPTRPQQEP